SLALNLPGLKDIEVVDTPGLNDPIVSRGRRTQEFLGQCDVIFLLSYCGQFLDSQDMALLAQNIPNKGIEEIILIGS
ncbi:dynamin family protein, partial [Streptomyces galilaeus]